MQKIIFKTTVTINDDSSVDRKEEITFDKEVNDNPQRVFDIMSSFLHECSEYEVSLICDILLDYKKVKDNRK